MRLMPNFLKQLLTEDDANSVYCPVRVFGATGATTFLALGVHHALALHQFDPTSFGAGFATIIGAIGAAIGVKSKLGADHA